MATYAPPLPTAIHRIVHIDCLNTILARGGLHSPNATPVDGLVYRTIHNANVQANRRIAQVPCGPRGTIHDYVPFYFGARSVMLLNLKSGRVDGYNEGQEPIIYLNCIAQDIAASGCGFAFSDGHGLANFTAWYDDLGRLDAVDWPLLDATYWNDTREDNDRQRRKQAEFLVHNFVSWNFVVGVVVLTTAMKSRVEAILAAHPAWPQVPVSVNPGYYY